MFELLKPTLGEVGESIGKIGPKDRALLVDAVTYASWSARL